MLGVAAIALFLSTVADSALGAAIGALAVLVASEVLVTLNSDDRFRRTASLTNRCWTRRAVRQYRSPPQRP